MLTTLSDNSEMWVYFKVPDKRYLEYMAARKQNKEEDPKVELVLSTGNKFPRVRSQKGVTSKVVWVRISGGAEANQLG